MRKAEVKRKTKETEVAISVNVDGSGRCSISTSIPFMDHMLELFAQHGLFDITVRAQGDIEVDYHHTVEDFGLSSRRFSLTTSELSNTPPKRERQPPGSPIQFLRM